MSARALGVVLTDLGGPVDESQVQAFIESLLSDPAVLPLPDALRSFVAGQISKRRAPVAMERYRAIGGGSPLHEEIVVQIRKVAERLGGRFLVRHAFRHSPPRGETVLRELSDAGVQRVIFVPLFPQRSFTTTDSCVGDLSASADRLGMACVATPSFPESDGYIEAMRQKAAPISGEVDHLLSVAHGLPLSHLRRGDPYVDEVWRTTKRLMRALSRDTSWSLAFQSRLGPARWVGPYLEDEIRRIASTGARSLGVIPVSFTNENLETLWDLDTEAAELARELGFETYHRIPTPGDHPAFIEEIAESTLRAGREAGWVES